MDIKPVNALEKYIFDAYEHAELSFPFFRFLELNAAAAGFVRVNGKKVNQLIQVCLSLQDPFTLEREVRGLVLGASYVKCSNLLLLTWDEERTLEQDGIKIRVLPVWKWILASV